MFGIFLFKAAAPTDHVARYRRGKLVSQGLGLSFWAGPLTSVAIVPTSTQQVSFSYTEQTQDGQEVVVNGQVEATYVLDTALKTYNFVVDPHSGAYRSNGNGLQLSQAALVNALRSQVRASCGTLALGKALAGAADLQVALRKAVASTELAAELSKLGFTVTTVNVYSVAPKNPNLADALQAPVRETLLGQAQSAIAEKRRKAAEDDRKLKEYEAETAQLLEAANAKLIEARNASLLEQAKGEAEAAKERGKGEADATAALLEVLRGADPAVLFAHGIREMAKAGVNELNITPEFLSLLGRSSGGSAQ